MLYRKKLSVFDCNMGGLGTIAKQKLYSLGPAGQCTLFGHNHLYFSVILNLRKYSEDFG